MPTRAWEFGVSEVCLVILAKRAMLGVDVFGRNRLFVMARRWSQRGMMSGDIIDLPTTPSEVKLLIRCMFSHVTFETTRHGRGRTFSLSSCL